MSIMFIMFIGKIFHYYFRQIIDSINKRNELLNKCRHANKFLLKNI